MVKKYILNFVLSFATVKVPLTGGDDRWETVKAEVKEKITGVHDVYFVCNGKAAKDIMFFDYWTFLENN